LLKESFADIDNLQVKDLKESNVAKLLKKPEEESISKNIKCEDNKWMPIEEFK